MTNLQQATAAAPSASQKRRPTTPDELLLIALGEALWATRAARAGGAAGEGGSSEAGGAQAVVAREALWQCRCAMHRGYAEAMRVRSSDVGILAGLADALLDCGRLLRDMVARGIDVVSGGTDNHVVLLDLRSVGMTGKVADLLVSDVHMKLAPRACPLIVGRGVLVPSSAIHREPFDIEHFGSVSSAKHTAMTGGAPIREA